MAVERNGDPSKGDVQPFLAITNALGFNAYQTAVSCPIAGVNGYGGAMGPAQFIPSTWFGYISTLQTALGHYPNPWAAEDAFLASATLLTDKGAAAGGGDSASAQNRAACSYYGTGLDQRGAYRGISCSYSRSVMKFKSTIQANIDLL